MTASRDVQEKVGHRLCRVGADHKQSGNRRPLSSSAIVHRKKGDRLTITATITVDDCERSDTIRARRRNAQWSSREDCANNGVHDSLASSAS